jgi:hypothetical protein
MIAINLLPESCVVERHIRSRLRVWSVVAPLIAAILVASYVWLAGMWGVGAGGVSQDRERLEQRISEMRRILTRNQSELAEVESARRALRAVSDLPDWGLMLQLLPSMGGGHATLTSCTLTPAKKDANDGSKQAAGRVLKYLLSIQGVVEDPKSATDFAVDLERTEIFDKVTLIESTRTQYMGRELLGFRIECMLTDSVGEGQP